MDTKMALMSNVGVILLAIWLIILGIKELFQGASVSIDTLLSVLPIVAGVVILLGR